MGPNLVIKNVDIWQADTTARGVDVYVTNGLFDGFRQDSLTASEDARSIIDGSGLVLMPAGVDPQVHLRVPGQLEKETASSGLAAAVKGGVGALLTMPNTQPVIDNVDAVAAAKKELETAVSDSGVEVLISAAITKNQKGKELVDFAALHKAGIAAFTDDGVGVMSDELMAAALAFSEESGLPVLQHAEMVGHGGVLAPGPAQERTGVKAYPFQAESDMVERDLKLLRDFPHARYHVLHVSSKATLDLVAEAKSSGLRASCEVSPHHLFFTSEDIDEKNTSFKMNPPLRSKLDREALVAGLADGTVDFVATDHAPHEPRVKETNLAAAAYGTTGLETSLQVLLTLHKKGQLSAKRLVEVFSYQPAKFLGLDNSFGQFTQGKPFRALLVDVQQEVNITEDHFAGKSKNSCFLGSDLQGSIKTVFLHEKLHQL